MAWSAITASRSASRSRAVANSIQGAEFDYRQGFTFLPGLLADTGMEFNVTYAPGNTGAKDLAGHTIPFPDNSTESGNLILWFQDNRFQTRARVQLPLAARLRERHRQHRGPGGVRGAAEVPRRVDPVQVQQVRHGVRRRQQSHQRVSAVLPRMAQPGRARQLLRAHVHGWHPRAVVIARNLIDARCRGVERFPGGAEAMRLKAEPKFRGAGLWALLAAVAATPLACAATAFTPTPVDGGAGSRTAIRALADPVQRQGPARWRRSLLCRVFHRGWYPVSGRATVMAGLLENGRYKHVFHGDNLRAVAEPDSSGSLFVDSLVVPHRVHGRPRTSRDAHAAAHQRHDRERGRVGERAPDRRPCSRRRCLSRCTSST